VSAGRKHGGAGEVSIFLNTWPWNIGLRPILFLRPNGEEQCQKENLSRGKR